MAPPRGDRWGPGSRIPTVIASPYAKKRFVDHTVYDTTSILQFETLRAPALAGYSNPVRRSSECIRLLQVGRRRKPDDETLAQTSLPHHARASVWACYGDGLAACLLDVNGARSTTSVGARSPAKMTSSKPPTKPKFLRNCQKCSRAWLLSLWVQKSG